MSVWLVVAATCGVRLWVIWGSFFWQDDYIHIWTAWNGDLVWQNWNGHREPASFAVQWLLARAAPQVWWPAAVVLSVVAVATTVMFWLMLRRWGGVTPATASTAILFAAWPATLVPQQWLSAGLETIPLALLFTAGSLLAKPGRWTPWAVGLLAALAWGFHERAVYLMPVLFAIAWMYTPGRAWRDNRASWIVLLAVTAAALFLRIGDGLPGRAGGTSVPGALWYAGPGSVLRSVLGWLPFDGRPLVPVSVGLWGLAVLTVWMLVLLVGLSTQPRRTLIIAAAFLAVFLVEVLSFVALRGGFAGARFAADPRFTLVAGTVLLAGLGSVTLKWRPAVALALGLAVLGSWSMWRLGVPEDPGRQWLADAHRVDRGAQMAATPSPPQMLAHFFFTTTDPVYELGTTRTLLQVGARPYDFPELAAAPVQVDESGRVGPLRFTPLVTSEDLQCGAVPLPGLDAGVRVARLLLEPGARVQGVTGPEVYVFPPAGPLEPVQVTGCVRQVEMGIPGR
ncbi:MAG: hypothetical protein R2720_00435 [Candidatus Nanopelagicales bacterium]